MTGARFGRHRFGRVAFDRHDYVRGGGAAQSPIARQTRSTARAILSDFIYHARQRFEAVSSLPGAQAVSSLTARREMNATLTLHQTGETSLRSRDESVLS